MGTGAADTDAGYGEPRKRPQCPIAYVGVTDLVSLRVGQPFPQFILDAFLPPVDLGQIECESLKGRWILIWTFPTVTGPGVVQEIIALGAAAEQFATLNCYVMGISNESPYAVLGQTQVARGTGGLGEIALPIAWNVVKGDHFAKCVYVVDDDGVLRYFDVSAPGITRSPAFCLGLLKALKFTKETPGMACPSGWKEGDPLVPAGGPRPRPAADAPSEA